MDKYLVTRIEQTIGIDIGDSSELILGYGEWCVVILSEVLNKYLMEQNFSFNKPNLKKFKKEENLNLKNGVVDDFNSSLNKTSKGLKFNKTNILLKLDRLDNKKLDSDYDYFIERVSLDKRAKYNNKINNFEKNDNNYSNDLIKSFKINIKEINYNYELNDNLENMFERVYLSNKNNNLNTDNLNLIDKYNNNIKNNIDYLSPQLNYSIHNDVFVVDNLINRENHLFGNPSDKSKKLIDGSFSSLRESLINAKSRKTEYNHILIEKKQSIINKEKKLETINGRLNKMSNKLSSVDEKSPYNIKNKLINSINLLRKDIISIDLKNAILDTVSIKSHICQVTNHADLKKFINSKGILFESDLNGNLFDEHL